MTVISQLCSSSNSAKNPCKKLQTTSKPVSGYFLAKKGQSFASIADVKTEWRNQLIAKKIQVGYGFTSLTETIDEGITQTATRDSKDNLSQHRIEIAHKVNAYQADALKSWENAYSGVYFYTQDGALLCEVSAEGVVTGLPLYTLLTGVPPITGGENYCKVFLQLKDHDYSEIVPDIDFDEEEGIYNVDFTIISVSATEIKFTAKACCEDLATLVTADLTLVTAEGVAQSLTVVYANGVYTGSGTSLESGVLATAGVVDKTEFLVEGEINVTI